MKHFKVGKDIEVYRIGDRVSERVQDIAFPKVFWVLTAIAVSYLIGQTIFLFTTR